jgi:tetratricopeptide (TPR) repeat protein
MGYDLTCSCGKVHPVTEGMAGSSISCGCGITIAVPLPAAGPCQPVADAGQLLVPVASAGDETPPQRIPPVEIIAPTQVVLRKGRCGPPDLGVSVSVLLTPGAVWIQDTWQVRSLRLQDLVVKWAPQSKDLRLALGAEPSAEKLILEFASAPAAEHWYRRIQGQQEQQPAPSSPESLRHHPEGVSLVRQAPEIAHRGLGWIEFTGRNGSAADRGLQLRAAIHGADAVIRLNRQRCPELGWAARRLIGLAVRVEDADARDRLRLKWYGEEVSGLLKGMLLLLVLEGSFLLAIVAMHARGSSLTVPTGKTPSETLASGTVGLALVVGWPVVLLALLWALRWPQLLPSTGVAVLAAATGRGLAVWLGHLAAILTAGASLVESKFWMLLDPVDWALVIAGAVLGMRAWRLAADARKILPQELQAASASRRVSSGGVLAVTGIYALLRLGLVATSRYQGSRYLLQPGVDTRHEQEALRALNQGVAYANQQELDSADRSFERALRLWEQLTARPSVPLVYRTNLGRTLNNLGWLRQRQGRPKEAEPYYVRSLEIGEALARDTPIDDEFKRTMADARDALSDLRSSSAGDVADEKDRAAGRKYEEAQVRAQKGEPEAERLYREAITVFEEVLPHATSEAYRRFAVGRLATAYLQLGDLQQQLGKRSDAEESLKKAISHGERALVLEPDSPLNKHNLDVAVQMLDELREEALHEAVSRLCREDRFADAVAFCRRGIEELEGQLGSSKDPGSAVRRLAYRLDRFARLLAHCPDARVRDVKAALKHARRATELQPAEVDYWYTLAEVHYRNGDWRESLAALERRKAMAGEFDANGWFLSAMNLHRLQRREEAQAALRAGDEWIIERRRQAGENPVLRFQYELTRPAMEALRREAGKLLQGNDPNTSAASSDGSREPGTLGTRPARPWLLASLAAIPT